MAEFICPVCGLVDREGTGACAICPTPHRTARRPTGQQNKQSLYFSQAMLDELRAEADRLDRSVSWVIQRAWKRARKHLKNVHAMPPVVPVDHGDTEARV